MFQVVPGLMRFRGPVTVLVLRHSLSMVAGLRLVFVVLFSNTLTSEPDRPEHFTIAYFYYIDHVGTARYGIHTVRTEEV